MQNPTLELVFVFSLSSFELFSFNLNSFFFLQRYYLSPIYIKKNLEKLESIQRWTISHGNINISLENHRNKTFIERGKKKEGKIQNI